MQDSLENTREDQDGLPRGRAMGAPLSIGGRGRAIAAPTGPRQVENPLPAPPAPQTSGSDPLAGNIQKAISAFKVAVPFVQKLLPLLEGPMASAMSSVLTKKPAQPASRPQSEQRAVVLHEPAKMVDLAPLKGSLNQLQMEQHELRGQIQEQNASLKRVEDRLEMVREATDRNTLEQQELLDDLKNVGRRVNIVTLILMAMLLISVLLNLILYLHIQRVLP